MAIPNGWLRPGDEPFDQDTPDNAFGWEDGHRFLFEERADSWSAFSLDLPGLCAAGFTWEEVEQLLHDAIPCHLAVLDEPLPAPAWSA